MPCVRFAVLFLLRAGFVDGCVEYAARTLENKDGKAALRIGRSMGAQELAMARAGSVTLQKAAQIIEYERSVKSTVVSTRMRMMVIEEIL
jgi:hypothetical protein